MTEQAVQKPASEAIWSPHGASSASVPARTAVRRVRGRGAARGLAGLAVAALVWLWHPLLGALAAGLAGATLVLALVAPEALYQRLEAALAAFGRALGLAVSWVTLTVLHLAVFVPLGLVLRATGRLRLDLALAPDEPTYWRPADAGSPQERRHERQF
ncbi:MAG: hypothetical protein ACLF0P_09525 [Thermoanaerobaculia bacterium]